jgi:hypothetical protein
MPLYAQVRAVKISTPGNLSAASQHNFRERPTPNADPSRTHLNEHHGVDNTADLMAAFRAAWPERRRKDAVLAIDYLMTASPEWWDKATPDQQREFFDRAEKWLHERHGRENVIYFGLQLDERTPHAVAYVVPRTEEGKLAASRWLDGKAKLAAMQTSFATEMEPLGLVRGIEGSSAKHERVQRAYGAANERFDAGEKFAQEKVAELTLGDRAALLVGKVPPTLADTIAKFDAATVQRRLQIDTAIPRAEQRGYLRGLKDLPEREAALEAERERVDEMRERVREREYELRQREREYEKTRVQEFESHMRAIGAQIAARGQEYVGQIVGITKSFAAQITEDFGLVIHPIHDWLKTLKERLEAIHRDDDYAVIKYSREGSPEVRQARDEDLERHRDRSRDRGVELDNDRGFGLGD